LEYLFFDVVDIVDKLILLDYQLIVIVVAYMQFVVVIVVSIYHHQIKHSYYISLGIDDHE
jgi:hypothetical protein